MKNSAPLSGGETNREAMKSLEWVDFFHPISFQSKSGVDFTVNEGMFIIKINKADLFI